MRVHIVEKYHSRAMRQYVDPLMNDASRPKWLEITESADPDWDADLNYFIPWHDLAKLEPQGKSIAAFTHVNMWHERELATALSRCDAVVCLSEHGRGVVRQYNTVPTTAIPLPVRGFAPRKRNIVIVGDEQPNGRKRSWLLLELAWHMSLKPFHFNIVGNGWEGIVQTLGSLGVSATQYKDVSHAELQAIYQMSDCLLVTGFVEGGPLPVVEALSCGIPVISPKYGYAADLLDAAYFYDSIEDLMEILTRMHNKVGANIHKVAGYTVNNYRQQHYKLFMDTVGLVTDRYQHVPRLVRECKATKLMEIGTCGGERALAMIEAAQEASPGKQISYYGFDLFRELTDEEMQRERSKQPLPRKIVEARLNLTGAMTHLYEGFTKDTIPAVVTAPTMDFIFIDGGHSIDTITADWMNLQRFIGDNTVVLFDDYYVNNPPKIGCQQLIESFGGGWRVEYLDPVETWGDLQIRMVKVVRNAGKSD